MNTTINHELMRRNNKSYILTYIRKNGPVSKKELSEQLGISITSVTTFINELMTESKVIQCGNSKSTGGRKSELFLANPDALYVIGIDLQIDRMILLLLNFNGDIIATIQVPYDQKDEWFIAELLVRSIQRICEENSIIPDKLAGIGIGVPGFVNHETDMIELAPKLEWKNVNLRSMLSIDKPIVIENEANAAVIGEASYGVAKGVGNVIYISVAMGIGVGMILNNHLFYGSNYLAGEFGHMVIVPYGLPCLCGSRGCLESYASITAALRAYREQSGIELSSFSDFVEMLAERDAVALHVLEDTAKFLGLGISNLINILNPEMIVIGGEIAMAKEYLYPALLRVVKKHSIGPSFKGVSVQFSTLNGQAAALGVAGMVIEQQLLPYRS